MNYFNPESNDIFIEQDLDLNDESKPDLILKMGLAELVIHATILLLLV